MVFKAFLTTFALVFLAELGDKTQLATMLMVSQGQSAKIVFLGAASALVLSSLIGVLAGAWLTRVFPPNVLQTGAGVAFMIIGLLLLLGKF
ncbi:MAG: TMEM165/GDT1 family protein [Bacillota bacterium]|nr:TMEM165/GDT1 family protein [Bacillota bacterium]MDW7684582.1 TMEM165/GDT1 family protein [Bacillota bacterium]